MSRPEDELPFIVEQGDIAFLFPNRGEPTLSHIALHLLSNHSWLSCFKWRTRWAFLSLQFWALSGWPGFRYQLLGFSSRPSERAADEQQQRYRRLFSMFATVQAAAWTPAAALPAWYAALIRVFFDAWPHSHQHSRIAHFIPHGCSFFANINNSCKYID